MGGSDRDNSEFHRMLTSSLCPEIQRNEVDSRGRGQKKKLFLSCDCEEEREREREWEDEEEERG